MKARIALLGAMGEETHLLEAALTEKEVVTIAGRDFFLGLLHGIPVVTGFSKWGKVAAAISTTIALERFGVDEVLFLGVAGSLSPRIRCGDIIVASHCLQYDMDVSALPDYEKWEIPLLKIQRFEADPSRVQLLRKLSLEYVASHPTAHWLQVEVGLLATADSFLADSARKKQIQSDLPDVLAFDMESAAVAQVCHEFQRPCNVVRIISDGADDAAVEDFQQFIQTQAAPAVKEIALRYVATRFAVES